MKILKNKRSLLNAANTLLLCSAVLISSCKKDHDNDHAPANLKLINGVTGSAEYKVNLDNTTFSDEVLAFSKSLPYKETNSGHHDLTITEVATGKVVSSTAINLSVASVSSVYAVEEAGVVSTVLINDDLSAPAAGKAKIRFVNMSTDAGSLDIAVTGQSTALFSGVKFKGFTEFISVDPGTKLNFFVKNATNNSIVSLDNVTLESGKVYTLWAKGKVAATTTIQPLALGLITNK